MTKFLRDQQEEVPGLKSRNDRSRGRYPMSYLHRGWMEGLSLLLCDRSAANKK